MTKNELVKKDEEKEKSGLDFPLNKGFVSQLQGGISDNLNHKKSAQMSSR